MLLTPGRRPAFPCSTRLPAMMVLSLAAVCARADGPKAPAADAKALAGPAAASTVPAAGASVASKAKPGVPAPKAEEVVEKSIPGAEEGLRKLLASRLGGTGELTVNAAAQSPAAPSPSRPRRPATPPSQAEQLAAAHRAGQGARHWSYQGESGPERWADLSPDFAACATGKRQSPIDIRDGIAVQLDPVKFDYQPSAFRVSDNGHTIQVTMGAGNSIEVLGRRYELVQFHFHKPSEERINNRQFDMVAHLVHKDPEGRLAVVAVLLTRGSAHDVVQTVWNYLPLERGEDVSAPVTIDLNGLLPEDRRYYTYMGSLTTPPCSEGVLWMVLKTPSQISLEQLGVFSRLYPMNARPLQPASGRMIKESR